MNTTLWNNVGCFVGIKTKNTQTQQHTHTKHKKTRCGSSSPSLHGNISHGPKSWCSCSQWDHARRAASGVLSLGLVLLFGASKHNPSNNKVKGGVSAIGGHCLVKKYNNEQKDGVFSGGGYRRGRATWAERVGVHFGIVWGGE
jgi:hypothetical protein